MIVTDRDGTTLLGIEEYDDLLAVRALPEYRFVDDSTVETATTLLHTIGLAPKQESQPLPLPIHDALFDYQSWTVEMAFDRRRFAIFADTGLGKTLMQLEWARQVTAVHGGRTLLIAPLNVVSQTIDEAARFYGDSMPIYDARDRGALQDWLAETCQSGGQVAITNYEKLDDVTTAIPVDAVVLDESSILKQTMGKRRTAIMAAFRGVPWKLCCSATPAPNDRIEYGEHAYFLDVVRSTREFLAAFFVNRDGEWQLKRHGIAAFYRHLASWSVFMRDPAAYGFADHNADRPPLHVEFPTINLTDEQIGVARGYESGDPSLFGVTVGGITSRTKVMQIAHGFLLDDKNVRRFPSNKPEWIARLANETHGNEQVLVWVTFDEEGDQLARMIPDSVHLSGKTSRPKRDATIDQFRNGEGARVLIVKPSMFGFGLNLQSCSVQVFSTITDSFERYYQSIRRSWRYGQQKPVRVYVPLTPLDEAICQNVLSKQETFMADARNQEAEFVRVLRPADTTERRVLMTEPAIELDRAQGNDWTLILGDSIAHMDSLPEDQFDLAVFSPPFANLFTYSSEAGDMGNVKSDLEYRLQWKFFAERLERVMKPGRIVAVHCAEIIRFAGQHGYRHTYDYPSDLRQGMEDAGFVYCARIAVDKNPQIQAIRTKDQNLLFATLKRDALNSHPQASEAVLVFRKRGEPDVPVIASDITDQEWIQWAHHVWYGIRETDVLNAALGKEHEDERHICPLQLSLIERCVRLWSNVGETVFSPFAGIGSEGYEALSWGRKFYGVELKRSYFETAQYFLRQREAANDVRLPFEDAHSVG